MSLPGLCYLGEYERTLGICAKGLVVELVLHSLGASVESTDKLSKPREVGEGVMTQSGKCTREASPDV